MFKVRFTSSGFSRRISPPLVCYLVAHRERLHSESAELSSAFSKFLSLFLRIGMELHLLKVDAEFREDPLTGIVGRMKWKTGDFEVYSADIAS